MKESKIIRAAKAAKADGYKYMSSVVKSCYNTIYHHVVEIDSVIAAGKWIPAYQGQLESGARCRIGQIHEPKNCINKSVAINKYCRDNELKKVAS